MIAAHPVHHRVAGTTVVRRNVPRHLWVLFDDEGNLFLPLVDYMIERDIGLSTQRHIAMSVGLLIDYMVMCEEGYSQNQNKAAFLADFAWSVLHGTLHDSGDRTGLYWRPRKSIQAKKIVNSVCEFLDWLIDTQGLPASDFYRSATVSERLAYWRYFNRKKHTSFLNHTRSHSMALKSSERVRRAAFRRSPSGRQLRPPRFPENRIFDLLFKGFVKPGKKNESRPWVKYDLRNILITILLHGGGLRVSEPFHLYSPDISPDPYEEDQCVVRVFHPTDGSIKHTDPLTNRIVTKTRAEYLLDQFARQPRHEMHGREHAGWKEPFLTEASSQFYMHVHWFPRYWGVLFRQLYSMYIEHVLPIKMDHPYVFVCTTKRFFGKPYTVPSYRDAHKRAVEKIGLEYKKGYGTTPHGHRHAYGQNLKDAGVDVRHIQICLHHRSALSQLVYTEPTVAEINSTLNKAASSRSDDRLANEIEEYLETDLEDMLRELLEYK